MNPSTTRAIPPATTGRFAAAPPNTQAADDHGWAMLPHSITSDKRLSAIQVRVVAALMCFAVPGILYGL